MRWTSALLTKGSYPLQHSAQPGGQATFSGISLRCARAQLDDASDRGDERRIVVILIDPFAARDFIRIVIAGRLFVELDRDVLFVDLDSVDVLERARVEQLRMRRLAGPARVAS